MVEKKLTSILVLVVIVCIFVGCGTKKNDTAISEKKEDSELGSDEIIDKTKLDYSKELNNIKTIKDENITEARIYWANEIYRTTDKEVIEGLKKVISTLELEEIVDYEQTEVYYGEYNLYLLNDNEVVYYFNSSEVLHIGDKEYGPYDQILKFNSDVMGYCKETFWNVESE